ncbi:hypothetical protein BGW42_004424 [Actinomortierella wolfii]|nr:hypothetical protein BGW42_004424 [Actinomortierella wolfii]
MLAGAHIHNWTVPDFVEELYIGISHAGDNDDDDDKAPKTLPSPPFGGRFGVPEQPLNTKAIEQQQQQQQNTKGGKNRSPFARAKEGMKHKVNHWTDEERNLQKRKELLTDFQSGYFAEFSEINRTGAKLWHAAPAMMTAENALYMPNIIGTSLKTSETVELVDLLKGKVSMVAISGTRFGEEQLETFMKPFLERWPPGKAGSKVQLVELNIQENPLKAGLVRMMVPFVRKSIPENRHANYILHYKSIKHLKEPLCMQNSYLGYVFLVDGNCKIRWGAHGKGTEAEINTLLDSVQKLTIDQPSVIMLGHLAGKPTSGWDRLQVTLVLLGSYIALRKMPAHGPSMRIQALSKLLGEKYTPWQITIAAFSLLYIFRHGDLILGLNVAEGDDKMYARRHSKSFTRAMWVLSALDAAFFTAQPIRPAILRHSLSLIFALYYLLFPARAAAKNQRVRAHINAEQMRASWQKSEHPALQLLQWLQEPRLGHVQHLTIRRSVTEYGDHDDQEASRFWVYFAGTSQQLQEQDGIILDFPGGGFVTMGPLHHSDYLKLWAKKTGYPVVSIDYGKAPEFPYPYGLNECFDVYRRIVATKGKCVGLSGKKMPRIVLVGDSAGANFVASIMIKILESPAPLPRPVGLVCIYPCFDIDYHLWVRPDQLALIEDELEPGQSVDSHHRKQPGYGDGPLVSSRVCYFDDPIICPEFARAMAIMYTGSNAIFSNPDQYETSPIRTPDHLLQQFPPVFIMSGQKDPLVDDSLLFMARLKRARRATQEANPQMIYLRQDKLRIVRDVSHGFLHLMSLMPDIRDAIVVLGEQLKDMLQEPILASEGTLSGEPQQANSEQWGSASAHSITEDLVDVSGAKSELRRRYVTPTSPPSQFEVEWTRKYTCDPVSMLENRAVGVWREMDIEPPMTT